jgi:hypothetical protein
VHQVGRRPLGRHADDHGRRAVAEDHARGPDVADLVGELLDADHEHRPLHLLQQPGGLREPYDMPAQAAMMSYAAWVWPMPSWPQT